MGSTAKSPGKRPRKTAPAPSKTAPMALPAPENQPPVALTQVKSPKLEIPQKLRDEISGILMLACSVLLLTGFFIDSSSVLCRLSSMVIGVLGCGAYLFSLILWLWGIERFRSKPFFRGPVDYAGWTLSFFTLVVSGQALNSTGGTLGATLWPILVGAFGRIGSGIVLTTCAIISLVLVLEILFSDFLARAQVFCIKAGKYLLRVSALALAAAIKWFRAGSAAVWIALKGAVAGALDSLRTAFSDTGDEDEEDMESEESESAATSQNCDAVKSDHSNQDDEATASSCSRRNKGRGDFAGREIVVEAIETEENESEPVRETEDERVFDYCDATEASEPSDLNSSEYISRLDSLLSNRDDRASDKLPDKQEKPERDILAGVNVISTSGQQRAQDDSVVQETDETGAPRTLSGSRLPSDLKALLECTFEDDGSEDSYNESLRKEDTAIVWQDDTDLEPDDSIISGSDFDEDEVFTEDEQLDLEGEYTYEDSDSSDDMIIDGEAEIDESWFGEDEEDRDPYVLPPVTLLDAVPEEDVTVLREELREKGERIITTLSNFSIEARIVQIVCGPSVTQFEIKIAKGVKVSKIYNLQDDIGLALATSAIRIEAPIPGKSAIGIEIPNSVRTPVVFREIMEDLLHREGNSPLSIGFGKDIAGRYITADLAKMPHLLVAGATGSGKSVCMNTIVCSMLFLAPPEDVKFIMVDPKMVEMAVYKDIPHLMVPPVVDAKEAAAALNWCVNEMERRYELLSAFGIRHISSYNKMVESGDIRRKVDRLTDSQIADFAPFVKLPFIVVIIDELADLMMVASKDVETAISRLAAKARAIGIHLVIATQRPSVNVITGVIKANLPSRIAFAVSSVVDSKTILDSKGAERLLGQGDMLFSPVGQNKPTRLQGAFISDDEVERLCDFLREQGEPSYDMDILKVEGDGEEDDVDLSDIDAYLGRDKEIVRRAAVHVIETGHASASGLQRSLRLGYARAGRIVDTLEKLGIIGPKDSRNNREILMTLGEAEDIFQS